jgi:hypothetical protein
MNRLTGHRLSGHGPLAVFVTVLLASSSITFVDARAQSGSEDIKGIVALHDWPEERGPNAKPIDYSAFRLLPFIDTLTVGYRFDRSRGRPMMEFALEWAPGDAGIVRGRRVDAKEIPGSVVIESIELAADVEVNGEPRATFYLPLDTLNLRPGPSVALVEVRDIAWDALFVDTDSASARQIFSSGFRLKNLRILRVVFTTDRAGLRYSRADMPEDDWTTVVVPDVDVWVAWGGRTRWRPPVTLLSPADRDRRDEIGRGDLLDRDRTADRGYDRADEQQDDEPDRASESSDDESGERKTSRRKRKGDRGGFSLPGKKKSDDDDDDEEDRLLPGALAGAAAIGALAAFGGTIGYYGSFDHAPIGLMAGRVEPRGGVLFHVAVNRQVFGKAAGPENLSIGVTGFVDVFRSRIQPAIGLGMRITEEGTETTRTLATIAPGIVANFDLAIVHVAYDVESNDVRFGFGINIRAILASD